MYKLTDNDEANRGDLDCPKCMGKDFIETMEQHPVNYADEAMIDVIYPCLECEDCGHEFTDSRCDWAVHWAVIEYKRQRNVNA